MSDILVVEDDPILARGLQVMLQLEGYGTFLANSLHNAGKLLNENLSLVILDINLPDGNGFHLLKKIQQSLPKLPVIILTATSDEDSVVYGLELGAKDYVRKPFGNRELMARIGSTLKQFTWVNKKLQIGQMLLLPEQRKVEYRGEEIVLNRREFDILEYLFKKAETIVTRDSLLTSIDRECKISDRTIDSHISHLRLSLKKAGVNDIKITSVYGIGYRLEKT